ncbi:MAG: restriction endonuclease subunit S [Pseudomonadota bacterium]|nr:restriction endonuclease subunit S [Pseudomonadota bacterium]
MLPKGWRQVPLHTVAEVRTGLSKNARREGATLKRPYIRVANVQDGTLDLADVKEIDVPASQTARYTLQAGDLLLIEGNGNPENLGRSCLWRGQVLDAVHQNHVFAVRTLSNELLPEFLEQQTQSEYGRNYFLSCAKGSTGLSSLNSSQLKSFPLVIPPPAEQRHIAQILSTWDQAIATTVRLLANSRTQWHALIGLTLNLRSANPDVVTPADNGGFPPSVQPGIPTLPPTPAGWRRIQLRDHLREVRRPVALEGDTTYRLVTVKRSRGGVELREVLRGAEVKTPSQFYVRADDFLISKRQIVHGACGIVPRELDGAVVSNEYAVLNSDGQIDLRFLRYLSESRYFQQTCFHSSIGVHVEKMIFNTERWLTWPFNIPPLSVQRKIVEVLDAARREVALFEAQIDKLTQEKAALMAQLLTGKRRVQTTEAETAP